MRNVRSAILVSGLFGFLVGPPLAHAQHEGHGQAAEPTEATEPAEASMHSTHEASMSMTGVLGIPMHRHASGTAWQPDETPMHALHGRVGEWALMFHGAVFAGYDYQGSEAGQDELLSANWFMAMADHELAGGQISFRTMLSLDPLTMGGNGYPLLLQTGETYEGEPLVDRQHPHDLFMELAARYERELAGGLAFSLYGGPAGEPALGPVGFPHRFYGLYDPMAPLSHHWQDSTHITFGVVTLGVFSEWIKGEVSWFNGREPDEDRYDFDLRGFDSFSARLSANPTPRWSLQASYGYLDSPETLEPEVSVQRLTASATYATRLGTGAWSTTAVWGQNRPSDEHVSDSALLESAIDLGRWGTTFGRAEYVVKSGHDFGLPPPMEELELPVASLVLGHIHDLPPIASMELGIGVRGSVNMVGDDLEDRYGTQFPLGVMVFVRLQPQEMKMPAMGAGMEGMSH